jgi:dihydroorotate dehydrogenase electron transfer subunit
MPIVHKGTVVENKKVGSYFVLTATAAEIPNEFKPGNFVAVAIGDERSSLILRRAFSIYQVSDRGVYGGTIDIVVSPHGPGTDYLANLKRNDTINLVGPLGKPFSLPKDPVPCVLVGGGYGAAPLFTLAEALTARGCRVDFVLGASTQEKLFGMLEARRISTSLSVTTNDGTAGQMGLVTDVLPDAIKKSNAAVVYACGPMKMLQAVAEVAALHGIVSQTSVEESMACGIGVCMTCVLPIIGDDGVTRMLRSCVDGPAFRGDKVRWQEIGQIPDDTYGAPVPGNH